MIRIGGRHIVMVNGLKHWQGLFLVLLYNSTGWPFRSRNVIKKQENNNNSHQEEKQVLHRCSAREKQTKENDTTPHSKEVNIKKIMKIFYIVFIAR